MGTSEQDKLARVLDPGIWTIMALLISLGDNLLLSTNVFVTKECDAPESNNTWAGTELTGNVPKMTSADS
jgi:hypothetical protein